MGQKTHPKGFRLGYTEDWDSRWFSTRDYATLLQQDLNLRKYLKDRLQHAGVSRIEIERGTDKVKINIYTARPGIVIGKKGAEIEKLKADVQRIAGPSSFIEIHEIRRPDLDAQLVAENVAMQLERRIMFRRAMKESVARTMRMGAQGVRVQCAGRLGGHEIARTEWYREGRVPLHTLRADIQYGFAEAVTSFGQIGVKVWVYRGESSAKLQEDRRPAGGM
ncbi:MAG: 30S ribosomal protein S3 [Deltaproteobacteria bacterium]